MPSSSLVKVVLRVCSVASRILDGGSFLSVQTKWRKIGSLSVRRKKQKGGLSRKVEAIAMHVDFLRRRICLLPETGTPDSPGATPRQQRASSIISAETRRNSLPVYCFLCVSLTASVFSPRPPSSFKKRPLRVCHPLVALQRRNLQCLTVFQAKSPAVQTAPAIPANRRLAVSHTVGPGAVGSQVREQDVAHGR